MISSLLAGLVMGGISKITAPKAPKARPLPAFDFDKATLDALTSRRNAQDPQVRGLLDQQYKNALSLSRGEIPKEIQQAIRMTTAESASTRGLSAAQATNLKASTIGQTQLSLMAEGAQLTKTLETIRNNEWAVAADSALGQANRQFEAYSLSESARMGVYQNKIASHNSMWSMIGTGVFAGLNKQQPAKAPRPKAPGSPTLSGYAGIYKPPTSDGLYPASRPQAIWR